MPERLNTIAIWLATSGIKVFGILLILIILSQVSKWIMKLRRGIKNRFDEKEIQAPVPHCVLIWGANKKGVQFGEV